MVKSSIISGDFDDVDISISDCITDGILEVGIEFGDKGDVMVKMVGIGVISNSKK